MKKSFLFLAASLLALSASAANYYFNIVSIEMKDSSKMDIVITNNVKMNFTDTHLIVLGTGSEVAIERSNLARFTHSYNADAGVDNVMTDNSVRFQGDKVVFHSLPANTAVAVYDMSGTEVISAVAEGDFELDLSGLDSGMYIVNANGNSLKVTVK